MNLVSYSNPQVCTRSMRGQRGIRSQVETFSLVNATVELTRRMVLYSYALDFYNSIIGILLVWKRKLGQRQVNLTMLRVLWGNHKGLSCCIVYFHASFYVLAKKNVQLFYCCALFMALQVTSYMGFDLLLASFFMFYIGLISAIDTIFSSKFPCLDTGAGC